jgi:hypothetical protein
VGQRPEELRLERLKLAGHRLAAPSATLPHH